MNLNTQRSQAQTSQPQANTMVVEERQELVDMYRPIFREIDLTILTFISKLRKFLISSLKKRSKARLIP